MMKIVFFSGVGYDSVIGGRTVRLARGLSVEHEVHFVEMPSLRRWRIGSEKRDGVTVHTLLPRSTRMFFRRNADRLEREIGLSDAHLIVSHPAWYPFVSALKPASLSYDCLDHVSIHSPRGGDNGLLAGYEKALLEKADHVFAVSPELLRRMECRSKCRLLPNAAPDRFRDLALPLPEPPPVIGFHGALYEWIDYALLEEIAEAFPGCVLRLAGDVRDRRALKRLKTFPNVELLPAFRFGELPGIVGGFTVGIIPFIDDVVAKCSDPLKSYEYLALGRGVVSTVDAGLPAEVFRHAPRREFVAELRRLLDRPPAADSCRAAAAGRFWSDRCAALVEILRGVRG